MPNDKRLDQLTTLMTEAFEDLVEQYGGKAIRVDTVDSGLDMAALIGFGGARISGNVSLATSKGGAAALRRLAPITESDRDWLMELSNQLLGSLKRKLIARGEEINVGIPTVVEGDRLAVRLMVSRLIVCTQLWDFMGTCVSVQIGVRMTDDFDFATDSEMGSARENPLDSGDVLVF